MKKLLSFFQEGTDESFGRLASGVVIAAGVLIAFYEVIVYTCDMSHEVHTGLILELIGTGMLGKVSSKWLEGKNSKEKELP